MSLFRGVILLRWLVMPSEVQNLGSWTVQDNTFLEPIGLDGISIVDFGGSGFGVYRQQYLP